MALFPTSVHSWIAGTVCLIFSVFCICVSLFKIDVFYTLIYIPFVIIVSYGVIMILRGSSPTLSFTMNSKSASKSEISLLPNSKRFKLIAMPINHFGEKVRWCLDIIKCPYEEYTLGGLLSATFRSRSVPWLVDTQSSSIIGNSDEILMFIHAVYVPMLKHNLKMQEHSPSQLLAIEKLLERNENTIEWEKELNLFGHSVQGYCYYYHLAKQAKALFTLIAWGGKEPLVPWFDRQILNYGYILFKYALRDVFKLASDRKRVERLTVIQDLMHKVDNILIENEQKYKQSHKIHSDNNNNESNGLLQEYPFQAFLTGEHISYIDITFCALAAPLLYYTIVTPRDGSTSLYANGRFTSFQASMYTKESAENNPLTGYPAALMDLEQDLLSRPCGKYIVYMYNHHRKQTLF